MKQKSIKFLILAAFLSLACTTKVSEWVLLNGIPTDYALIYFHKDQISEADKQQNAKIEEGIKGANIQFRSMVKNDITSPFYGLYYKKRLFSKYEDPGRVADLATSPLREKISKELMEGKLCVMLYLKTGDPEKDNSRIQITKQALESSPFGKIITFIELNRNDKNENHFISMLLNVESDLNSINEPMLFGIFGRFRALEPLVYKGITEENIKLMINFLTADCSCLIKDNLPGTDILCTNNWENPATALVNKIIDDDPSLLHK
jgi:hypothetical protein